MRLVGGRWRGEGRVEIRHNGVWGTICDDDWVMKAAGVVCRELGFPSATAAPGSARFGPGNGEIWLGYVICLGDETSIKRCSHSGWGGIYNCHHGEDASVICSSKYERHTNAWCSLRLCLCKDVEVGLPGP